ncbi:dihydrolipoyllysine-residue acetyltransferase [Aquisalimonas sp.]|uniref:dihydrolipoyllysine-residue acetyltransferase n=1 Tax=unclassified Aquisalimonas TaxID=2644645 RepID=UPI0025B914CE|nr:dihydrolipoyllysine-residue acetyltransferase [Aquisalimonas sp.]
MMATKTITVPDIGDFDAVDVIEVLVSDGDTVEAEQSLITLESDKATMEVPAPEAGTVKGVKIKVGDQVKEGDTILELEPAEGDGGSAGGDAGEDAEKEPEPEAAKAAPEPEKPAAPEEPAAASAPAANGGAAEASAPPRHPVHQVEADAAPIPTQSIDSESHKRAHASPAVRRLARELGVDLGQVSGSGRKGRILKDDVQAYVKGVVKQAQSGAAPAAGAEGSAGIPAIPPVDFSKFGEVEEVPLSRIKKLSGPHLQRSWLNLPHVTQFDEADITELEAFRKAEKDAAEKEGVKLTPLAFMVKASAGALAKYRDFNSSLKPEGDAIIVKHYINVGVAVDTPQGLVVPVIRDADQKGVYQIARDLGELSAKARDGKLGPKDMQGGTFSISSLGGIGGTAFTPIVNAPEVAILGVSKSEMKPKWNGKEFEPRLMLPLSLSYDHRVIDGAAAARFTAYLAGLLADLRKLLL